MCVHKFAGGGGGDRESRDHSVRVRVGGVGTPTVLVASESFER